MGDWTKATEKDRVQRYVESFSRLAEIFQYMPVRKDGFNEEDIREIYESVRNQVCGSCGRQKECWGRDAERTYRMTYEMLRQVEEGEDSISDGERHFFHYCIKGRAFKEELKNGFYRAKLNLMWNNRMLENRAAVADQLQETAQIIKEIACTVFEAEEMKGELERKICLRLKLHRIWVKDLRILRDAWGHPEIILTMCTGRGHCVAAKEIAAVLSGIYGCSLVPARDSRMTVGKEQCTIHFVEETHYYMLTGMAGEACRGQAASGDSFGFLTGNHGQVVLSLSDGMGTGVEASKESQTVIELLEQFLEAGFTPQTAVKMINSAMVLQRGMQRFSTLDICSINLYNGQCELLKVGASTTFIRRNGWVETIHSTSLPVGVLQEIDFEETKKKLEPGDMIVMLSDGVLDALPQEEGEELMKYLILHISTSNPAEFAHILLEQVMEFQKDGPQDDMTILAGGFWKK